MDWIFSFCIQVVQIKQKYSLYVVVAPIHHVLVERNHIICRGEKNEIIVIFDKIKEQYYLSQVYEKELIY